MRLGLPVTVKRRKEWFFHKFYQAVKVNQLATGLEERTLKQTR